MMVTEEMIREVLIRRGFRDGDVELVKMDSQGFMEWKLDEEKMKNESGEKKFIFRKDEEGVVASVLVVDLKKWRGRVSFRGDSSALGTSSTPTHVSSSYLNLTAGDHDKRDAPRSHDEGMSGRSIAPTHEGHGPRFILWYCTETRMRDIKALLDSDEIKDELFSLSLRRLEEKWGRSR